MKIWPWKMLRTNVYDELVVSTGTAKWLEREAEDLRADRDELLHRLIHAEDRIRSVQLHLAGVKSERDERIRDIDEQAVLAQDQAAALRGEVRAETQRAEELADDVTQLKRVEQLLLETIQHYTLTAGGPLKVLLDRGAWHSLHWTEGQAKAAAAFADPSVDPDGWGPHGDPAKGWSIRSVTVAPLPSGPHDAALDAHYATPAASVACRGEAVTA
ncbi:hypothetical protein ACJ6WD_35320 [Streptomyces sp. VTCC 41912]|uniref:hypothetical protein n=1 Tax=Streptomyces sp. VTCC 41912 TaxID=3383243 RepID=UPI003896E2EA